MQIKSYLSWLIDYGIKFKSIYIKIKSIGNDIDTKWFCCFEYTQLQPNSKFDATTLTNYNLTIPFVYLFSYLCLTYILAMNSISVLIYELHAASADSNFYFWSKNNNSNGPKKKKIDVRIVIDGEFGRELREREPITSKNTPLIWWHLAHCINARHTQDKYSASTDCVEKPISKL